MTTYPHRPPTGAEVQSWAGDFSDTAGISFDGGSWDTSNTYGSNARSIRLSNENDIATLPAFSCNSNESYLVSVMMKTERFPGASVWLWGTEYPSGNNYNNNPEMCNSEAGEWQESLLMIQPRSGVTSHRFKLRRVEDQIKSGHSAGNVWIGQVKVFRVSDPAQPWGITAPGNRRAFDGTHVKVSDTGDWSINDGTGNFEPFLPLIAHPDYTDLNNIDKYAGMGFTAVTQINNTTYAGIAANAGLKYFVDIGRYCFPGASEYGNTSWLNGVLSAFASASHVDSCIGFYCDYENGAEHEYDKHEYLYSRVKNYFGDSRPVWINDQSSLRSRAYNTHGDVVGCYCNPWTNPNMVNLQTEIGSAQTLIAQPGCELPAGPMIVNLPHEVNDIGNEMLRAFALGAKGFSLFADRTNWDYGLAFSERPWFNSISAINALMQDYRPVINTVPWVDWTITHNRGAGENGVTVAGRDLPDGKRAVMIAAHNGFTGGDITFTTSFDEVGVVYDYLTDSRMTESNDNTFTISGLGSEGYAVVYFESETIKGTQESPHIIDVDGGRQSIDVLQGQDEDTTLVAVGDLESGAQSKEGYSHSMHITSSYGLGVTAWMVQNKANLTEVCQREDFKAGLALFRWSGCETNQGVYNGYQMDHLDDLLDIARPYNKKVFVDLREIRFGDSSLDLSDTPVPQYVKDNGWVTYSGNVSNRAVSSKIASVAACATAFKNCIKAFSRWDDDPAFGGIILPETTRSESSSSAGPFTGKADALIDLYIDMCDTVKPSIPKSYLGWNINFSQSGVSKLRELVVKMEATGGGLFVVPDSVASRDPYTNPNGGYLYDAYTLQREFRNIVPLGSYMATRDIEDELEDVLDMLIGTSHPNPIFPNFIFHFDWHPDYGSSWKQTCFNAVAARNGRINTQKPTSDNYKTGTTSQTGTKPVHATAVKNLQRADLTPTDAVVGDTDALSLWISEDNVTSEVIQYFRYEDIDGGTDPGTGQETYEGTLTNYEFYRYELGTGQYTVAGTHATRKWIPNNVYEHSFSPHIASNTPYLKAGDFNTSPDSDVGDRQRIPLDHLPAGRDFRLLILAMGSNTSSDSCWILAADESPVKDADTQLENEQVGQLYYQYARNPDDSERYFTGADQYADITVREKDMHLVRAILVDAQETADPSGIYGYIAEENLSQDDTFTIAVNTSKAPVPVLDNDSELTEIVDFPDYPDNAVLFISDDGREVLITPDIDYTGPIEFSYRAKNQSSDFLYKSWVRGTVVDSLPPVANDILLELTLGDAFVINFDDYISSPDGLTLSIDVPPESDKYNITNIGNTYTFESITPTPAGTSGNYWIKDSLGARAEADWRVSWIIPENEPPEPVLDQITTMSGVPAVIYPLQNDVDPNSDELIIVDAWGAEHGSITHTETEITYIPNDNFKGIETLGYDVADRAGLTAEGKINIVVTPPQGVGIRVGGVITAKVRIAND